MSFIDQPNLGYSYPLPPGVTITSANNIPSGSPNPYVIPDGQGLVRLANGFFSSNVELPPITAASVPVTIYRSSTFRFAVSNKGTDLDQSILVGPNECVRFVPTSSGWKFVDPEMQPAGAAPSTDSQQLSIGGTAAAPTLVISNGNSVPLPVNDFFRSGNGANTPDGTTDYTEGVTHNGFLGLGITANPIAPLNFQSTRADTVVLNSAATPHNENQAHAIGFDQAVAANGNKSGTRFQVPATTNGFSFWGGVNATSSKHFGNVQNRKWTIGDPSAPTGEGHWTIGTIGDDGFLEFRSPDAFTGNKIQGQVYFNGYSGNGNVSGSSFLLNTAANNAGSALVNRVLINGVGDLLVSNQAAPYADGDASYALLTVNGAIRVKGGAILTGNTVKQPGGIVFGADKVGTDSVSTTSQDSDGGITSLADGNMTFYSNGAVVGSVVAGGTWSKPGGGSWAATSDIRTKKDVKPLVTNVQALLALQPITFRYNGKGGSVDDGRSHTGFSAQDVQKTAFSGWVGKTIYALDGSIWDAKIHKPDEQILQLDTSNLVYELLGVCKAQQLTIDTLSARLDKLETSGKNRP